MDNLKLLENKPEAFNLLNIYSEFLIKSLDKQLQKIWQVKNILLLKMI